MKNFVAIAIWSISIIVVAATHFAVVSYATEPAPTAEQAEFFEKKMRPLFFKHCVSCHNEKKAEAGLKLDSRIGLLKGIEGVPVVVAGQPDNSRLVQVARYDGNVQMPPDGKLPEADLEALVIWVKTGAYWPDDKSTTAGTSEHADYQSRIAGARAKHWAFQPIREPALPAVQNIAWTRTPIDRLILRALEVKGLTPSPIADRRTLLRRVMFDLIGLPPTSDEADAFEKDNSPDALARVVDRLLAAPAYGERWGRHWLDIARYADTKGYAFTQDGRFPYAYTYRDYVVQSFNEDLPYDQFVKEQLAADQLPARNDNRSLAALGFLTVGRRFNNQHDDIDDRIDVVTRGLLGLTVTCARCHDHKFEAIPAEDYYSLYGIFRSTNEPGELPLIGKPDQSPETLAFQSELGKREMEKQNSVNEETAKVSERLRTNLADYFVQMLIDKRGAAVATGYDFKKREMQGKLVTRWREHITKSSNAPNPVWSLWHRFDKLTDQAFPEEATKIVASLADESSTASTNRLLKEAFQKESVHSMLDVARVYGRILDEVRSQWQAKLDEAKKENKAIPEQFDDAAAQEQLRQELFGSKSPTAIEPNMAKPLFDVAANNRILKFQNKIDELKATSPGAPARAMVLSDADRPFDAAVFIRGNPDRRGKAVPRQFLAVLSTDRKPYKKGSGRLELADSITDPQNPLTARVFANRLWQHHFGAALVPTPSNFGERGEAPANPALVNYLASRFIANEWSVKRLHRDVLSSSTYSQSSRSNPQGVKIDSENQLLWRMNRRRLEFEPLRDSILAVTGQLDARIGGRPIQLTATPTKPRRTLYGIVDRQDLPDLFRTFDFASPDVSTEQRPDTTVPQQALFAMNSPFIAEQSKKLAARIGPAAANNAKSVEQKIDDLYQLTLARRPQAYEIEFAKKFLANSSGRETRPSLWQYGYGKIDVQAGKLNSFQPLTHWSGTSWQPKAKFPDDHFQHLMIKADGGHPGRDLEYSPVLRWTAPRDGIVSIKGTLDHPQKDGDGVRAHIISGRQGKLGVWEALHRKTSTEVVRISVERGETLDFVVDCLTAPSFDGYLWNPSLTLIEPENGTRWDAKKDFHGPSPSNLTPWEMLAQVLLLTNEFAFVD